MKKLAYGLLASVFAINAFAADINTISPGDVLYSYGGYMGTDVKVLILEVYPSVNKVKVKRLYDGSMDFVDAQSLMTKNQLDGQNAANHILTVLGGIGLFCAISDCGSSKTPQATPSSPR